MTGDTKAHCPECDQETFVDLGSNIGLHDEVVRASNEEVVIEIECGWEDCDANYQMVYAFTSTSR